MSSDKDTLKKFIVAIVTKAASPIDKKGIMELGGGKIVELIHNARVEDDSVKSKTPNIRYIENQAFSLVSSGELKEVTGSKGAGWGGKFVPTGLSVPDYTPEPKKRPRFPTAIIKPTLKDISSPKEITEEMIIDAYETLLGVTTTKTEKTREMLNNPSRFPLLAEHIIAKEGLNKNNTNNRNVYIAILVFASSNFSEMDIVSACGMTDSSIDTKDLAKDYIKVLIETKATTKINTLSKNLLDIAGYSKTNTHTVNAAGMALASYVFPSVSSEPSPSPEPEPSPEPSPEPVSISDIDPRIDLSETPGLEERITSHTLTKADEELISNMIPLSISLDTLVLYLHESKDYYELAPIRLRFDRDNKLPYYLWQKIRTHSFTGTALEVSRSLLPVFSKLKSIVLRIDKIKNESDYASISKIFMNFPTVADARLDHIEIALIERYFSSLSTYPISSVNKERIARKIDILKSIPLNVTEKRIVAHNEDVMNAEMLQLPNELIIDNILYTHKKSILPDTLNFGRQYTLVELSTPESKEEKRLKSIASKINGFTASEVVSQIKDILEFEDEDYERVLSMFTSGKHTGLEEAIIYLNHRNLIDPIIYRQIENLLKR